MHDNRPSREASFVIPVMDGEIILGRRVNEPNADLYGGFGGKADAAHAHEGAVEYPRLITKLGGARVASIADLEAREAGLELPGTTAIREMLEEFVGKHAPLPYDAVSHVMHLGVYWDADATTDWNCRHYAAVVEPIELRPPEREISNVARLSEIVAGLEPDAIGAIDARAVINPMTIYALAELRERIEQGTAEVSAPGGYSHVAIPKLSLPFDPYTLRHNFLHAVWSAKAQYEERLARG